MEEEKTIIGAWLLGEHIDDLERLQPSDFINYGSIVKAIKEIGCDLFRISRSLNIPITDLTEMTSFYQPYLYKSAVMHMIDTKAKKYLSEVKRDTPITEIAERLSEFAEGINLNDVAKPAIGMANKFIEMLDKRANLKQVSWGIPQVDRIMYGIRRQELTTIGARPSVGKSAFCLQIGLSVAHQGEKVLYFPLEMSTEQTVERITLRKHNISLKALRTGMLTKEEWAEMSLAADDIDKLEKSKKFLIFEGVNNLTEIKRLIRIHKPMLVIIDQLTQLTDYKTFRDKREKFSYMTNELKRVSMAEDVAVILAAQVNRSAQEYEPTMAQLKESGSIEEDSDNVILLHRYNLEDLQDSSGFDENIRPIKIMIEKQRSGSTGYVLSKFYANKYTFYGV